MPMILRRGLLAIAAVSFSGGMALAFDMYNVTKENHLIPLSGEIGSNVLMGSGMNLDDPDNPVPAPLGPFVGSAAVTTVVDQINLDQLLTSSTSFIEDRSAYEFSRVLRANMRASFNFASGSAAYEYTKRITEDSDVIVALVTQSVTSPAIPPSNINWKNEPRAEKIEDKVERLQQFVADYGSHYVQTIRYGYKIAIFGRTQTKSEEEKRAFRAAFKAAFGGGGAGGSISDVQRTALKKTNVELRAEVTAGRMEPAESIIFYQFDQIVDFLKKLRSQEVKIYGGPIEIIAKSYWHSLTPYPRSREILAQIEGRVEAPFGVPKGSIISWYPPTEAQRRQEDGSITVITPEGWTICNGSGDSPDLTDRFVMATTDLDELGRTGGSLTHNHTAAIVYNDRAASAYGGSRATVQIRVKEVEAIPPFYKLIYLMRL